METTNLETLSLKELKLLHEKLCLENPQIHSEITFNGGKKSYKITWVNAIRFIESQIKKVNEIKTEVNEIKTEVNEKAEITRLSWDSILNLTKEIIIALKTGIVDYYEYEEKMIFKPCDHINGHCELKKWLKSLIDEENNEVSRITNAIIEMVDLDELKDCLEEIKEMERKNEIVFCVEMVDTLNNILNEKDWIECLIMESAFSDAYVEALSSEGIKLTYIANTKEEIKINNDMWNPNDNDDSNDSNNSGNDSRKTEDKKNDKFEGLDDWDDDDNEEDGYEEYGDYLLFGEYPEINEKVAELVRWWNGGKSEFTLSASKEKKEKIIKLFLETLKIENYIKDPQSNKKIKEYTCELIIADEKRKKELGLKCNRILWVH